MITEKEIIEQLKEGKIFLPPLTFKLIQSRLLSYQKVSFDAVIEVLWGNRKAKFMVEIKAKSTPQNFYAAMNQLKAYPLLEEYFPMIILPYLSDEQLRELEKACMSGIDLCGNGIIIVPGVFSVFRSGAKNCFPSTALIKNIYAKKTSLVGRTFLIKPIFNSVQDILEEISQRSILIDTWKSKPLSLSTVSKALKTLVDDLIIERNGSIRLLQSDKLIEKLNANYEPPTIKKRTQLKIPGRMESILKAIMIESWASDIPFVVTGLSSVNKYAVMQRGELLSVYCTDAEMLLENLSNKKTARFNSMKTSDRFPNVEIISTEDEVVYYDYRYDGSIWWASPVQVYLELMKGDKRDQETAEQVKAFILKGFRGNLK